jgi:hypothetical protein
MEKGNSEIAPAESQQIRDSRTPTDEQIAQRAHDRYLARGGAAGSAAEDWHAAERELRAELDGTAGISNHPPDEEQRDQAELPSRGTRRNPE